MGLDFVSVPFEIACLTAFGIKSFVQYCVFEHTLPPGSPDRDAIERDASFPEPSSVHPLKFPVNHPHFQVPQWCPYGERCSFPEPSFTYPSRSQ
jgi:hypothetical protein